MLFSFYLKSQMSSRLITELFLISKLELREGGSNSNCLPHLFLFLYPFVAFWLKAIDVPKVCTLFCLV